MSEPSEPDRSATPLTDAEQLAAANAAAAEQLELKLPDESSTPKDLALWAGVLALLTLIVYWPATGGSFLWRDDRVAMSRQFVGPGAMPRIWSERFDSPAAYGQPMYQPVAFSAYWLEYQLGGHNAAGVPEPIAYHIGALVVHAGTAILLWLMLRELMVPGAWLIAAVFALHPVHSETIAWIAEQSTLLAGLFFLASIYTYVLFIKWLERDRSERAAGQPGVDPAQTWGLLAGSIVLCLMAMLSHPSAVVLPAIILLILWWQRRIARLDATVLIALQVVGAALWLKNLDLHVASGGPDLGHSNMAAQVGAAGWAMVFCFATLIAPVRLSILHYYSGSTLGIIAAAMVLAALVAIFRLAKSTTGRALFAALAAFALLATASVNWFDASRLSVITDGTAYLAMLPPAAVAIVLLLNVIRHSRLHNAQTVVGLSTVLLIALGAPAWMHIHAFEKPEALWRNTLKRHPESALAEASLAEQLRLEALQEALKDKADQNKDLMESEFTESVQHAMAALRIDPSNTAAQHTWADILVARGDDAGALRHFQSALDSDPNNAQVRAEYGSALITLGRFEPAISQLNQSLALDPSSGATHRLLGKAYMQLWNFDRAISEEQIAVGDDPTDSVAWQQLAEAQAKAGKLKEAIESYARLGMIDPSQLKRPDLCVAIAKIKDRQGDFDAAVSYLQLALQIEPKNAQVVELLKIETEKQHRAAATRPSTRSSTGPATTQSMS